MNIKELKADIQKYLDENLVVERACYDLATEPMIFYQEALPMEADLLEDIELILPFYCRLQSELLQ